MADHRSKISTNSYMNDSRLTKITALPPTTRESGAYVSKGLAFVYLTFYFAALVTTGLLVSYFVPYKYTDVMVNQLIPCDQIRTTTEPTATTEITTTSASTTEAKTTVPGSTSTLQLSITTVSPIIQECLNLGLPGSFSLFYQPQKYSIYVYDLDLVNRTFVIAVDLRFLVLRPVNTIEMSYSSPFGLLDLAVGAYQADNNRPVRINRVLECYKVAKSRNIILIAETSFQARTEYNLRIKYKSGFLPDIGVSDNVSSYSSGLNELGFFEKVFMFKEKNK